MMSRKKQKKAAPKIDPTAFLRARLDALINSEAFSTKDDQTIIQDLKALEREFKPGFLLQTLLHARLAAPAAARARLDAAVPEWLQERGHTTALSTMVAGQTLSGELRQQALAWLRGAGADTQALALSSQDLFYQAHYYGDASQAIVTLVGYTDAKKRRAQGMAFLIDYNPPWEGAVKDVFLKSHRKPQDLVQKFLDTWARGGMALKPIGAGQVKTRILTALNCNRSAGIRLPRDLIAIRESFVRYVLPLPDQPDTPAFSVNDFDRLSRQGQRPEEIMHFEQTVGRRVRMQDGKELLIMGGPDWDEE